MTMQIELWHLVLLLIAFFGGCAGAGKLLLDQIQKNMDSRFKAQDDARTTNHDQLSRRLDALDAASRAETGQWQRVERELLNLKAELPLHYVRREDYVQAVATIMAKLDAMALRFENILLRGKNNER
jgi:hypothetical protein